MPGSTYTIDFVDIFNPQANKFCDYMKFPLEGKDGFHLYFQHVPALNGTVAMGLQFKLYPIPTIKLIAFSSVQKVKTMFPNIDEEITIFENDHGKPIECKQLIVALPTYVPLQARIKALQSPDRVITYTSQDFHSNAVTTHQNSNYDENVNNEIYLPPSPPPSHDNEPENSGINPLIKLAVGLYLFT